MDREAPSCAELCSAPAAGKVERHENFGVFVFLAPGRIGVIPLSETGIAKDGDVRRAFPVGADVEVIVLEVDPSGRRIRLSAKAVMEAREAEEVREWTERNAPPAEGFGTLADKLRSAFKSLVSCIINVFTNRQGCCILDSLCRCLPHPLFV